MDREQVLFRLFGKYCPEGTILYTEGSPGQELFVVQSGAVRLAAAAPGDAREGVLGPGELLGEESFIVRAPRAARAEVVRDARLIPVDDSSLEAVVRHGPQTAQLVFEHLLAITSRARGELTLWTVKQLLPRIAPNLTAAVIVPADLAERSGLVESDVLLVLEEFRRRGCLVREGERYRVADAGLLRRELDGFAAGGKKA